jgi:hypothetical protein
MMGEVLSNSNWNTYRLSTRTLVQLGFLDIEYQNYGWVWAKAKEDENSFTGNITPVKKAIRISFDKKALF